MHGKRRESHELYQHAADAARRQGFRYVADDFDESDARADALVDLCQSGRRLGHPALALAICADTAGAEKLVVKTSRVSPNATIWRAVQRPEIVAIIALHQNAPSKGIELLTSAAPYEHAYPDVIYVRGLAYLKMRRGAQAIAEFRKIADHEGASWGATWVHPYRGQYYALSYLGMARGQMLAGERIQAREAYEKFFRLWKSADPDLPILRQPKSEYAIAVKSAASRNRQRTLPNP